MTGLDLSGGAEVHGAPQGETPETEGVEDFPRWTVDVKPYTKGRYRGKYDIYVSDINGNLLVSSKQGYDHRQEAVDIAYRLFASPTLLATHLGVDPPELRTPEPAVINVWGLDGSVEQAQLR